MYLYNVSDMYIMNVFLIGVNKMNKRTRNKTRLIDTKRKNRIGAKPQK